MGRFSTVFLVLLLLFVTEMGPTVVQGGNCPRLSNNYKGVCSYSSNCAHVCDGEGGTGGYCHFFKCYCNHPC
ncbi:hypothetical protein ACJIZ3_011048 [Penstemon smallii]|uniref:Knottins-like domain-containing protein n=1 Tax=Penstemon smallii TaxID=265156 RepID=A0ABD3UK94_9LAMI